MQYSVFIHTNHKQIVGALVSRYSLKHNSPNADKFDVRFIHTADHDFRLIRDMEGKAILCRSRSSSKGRLAIMASSVILLDCAKLTHWRCEIQFNEMFAFHRDYMDWVGLKLEPENTIGLFEHEWNDLDRLGDRVGPRHAPIRMIDRR